MTNEWGLPECRRCKEIWDNCECPEGPDTRETCTGGPEV